MEKRRQCMPWVSAGPVPSTQWPICSTFEFNCMHILSSPHNTTLVKPHLVNAKKPCTHGATGAAHLVVCLHC